LISDLIGQLNHKARPYISEEIAAYLEACLEEENGDDAFIAKLLGDIARTKGMSQVACDAGLSCERLYKALSGERSPAFDTILKVIGALGMKLHAEAVSATNSMAQQRHAADRYRWRSWPTVRCLSLGDARINIVGDAKTR
jgi:probable addiction module antidote protein